MGRKPIGYSFVDLEGTLVDGVFKGTVIPTNDYKKYTFDLTKQSGDNAPSQWADITVDNAVLEGYVPLELQNNYKESITRADFARLVVAAISL